MDREAEADIRIDDCRRGGEFCYQQKLGIFNPNDTRLIQANVSNWGEYSVLMETGIHDPKNRDLVKAGSVKGGLASSKGPAGSASNKTWTKCNEKKVSAGKGVFRDVYCCDCETLHKNRYISMDKVGRDCGGYTSVWCEVCKRTKTFYDTLDEVKQRKHAPKCTSCNKNKAMVKEGYIKVRRESGLCSRCWSKN